MLGRRSWRIAVSTARLRWQTGHGLRLRFFCGNHAAGVSAESFEVLRGSFQEGLLLLSPAQGEAASSDISLGRGSVVQHDGGSWVCALQIDRYWFAVPLAYLPGREGAWTLRWRGQIAESAAAAAARSADAEATVTCLLRPTPTQSEREQLRGGVSTGVVAVDVLAPLGRGQSLLICGPTGSGKSMLAADIIEQVLISSRFDKIVKFCGDPCTPLVDMSLQRENCYAELAVVPTGDNGRCQTPGLLAPLLAAISSAEEVRDSGGHALLVLDTLAPLLETWQVALRWTEAERGAPLDPDVAGAQRRVFFANIFERASPLLSGGSLTLLALVESEAMDAIGSRNKASVGAAAIPNQRAYDLADFAGRKESEVERIRVLSKRGIALTDAILSKIGITPPGHIAADAASSTPASEERAVMRELQSLSDGQVVLDLRRASAGHFPAIDAATTLSRFGLGSTGSSEPINPAEAARAMAAMRDVRPPALQAVAAHLRTQLALEKEVRFRPPPPGESTGSSGSSSLLTDSDHALSRQMEVVQAALLQPLHSHLQTEEMVALLLATCSGALDVLPLDMACAAVRGGLRAPLLQYLHNTSPKVLEKIKGEPRVSESTARELDVAVRLFVALRQQEE